MPEHCLRFEDLISAPVLPLPALEIDPDDASTDPLHLGHHQSRQGRRVESPGNLPGAVRPGFPGRVLRRELARAIGVVINSGYAPTTLAAVPLFHVSGLHAQFLSALRGGRRLILMYKWDVEHAIDLIRDERCTQFNGAPVMMQQLLASPRFGSEHTASLFGLDWAVQRRPPGCWTTCSSSSPTSLVVPAMA